MADDKNVKDEMGAKDRSITSVKNKKKRYISPYGVVEAASQEEADKLIGKLKDNAKTN